jgi:hypothetical protein
MQDVSVLGPLSRILTRQFYIFNPYLITFLGLGGKSKDGYTDVKMVQAAI